MVKNNAGREKIAEEAGSREGVTTGTGIGESTEPELSPEELYEIELSQRVEDTLSSMTLEEKLCQMFIVTPEMLTGVDTATSVGETTKVAYNTYPVGGIIYFKKNLIDPAQTRRMLQAMSNIARDRTGLIPFLCVDEEGGKVLRIGSNPAYNVEEIGPMGNIASAEEAYRAGNTIGSYLYDLGFNLDFAPCADVLTNPLNDVIGDRSFGEDPDMVSEYAGGYSDGLHDSNILSAYKHFPGHGATEADSHDGFAYTDKTLEEMREQELKPFGEAGLKGADFVMVGHIACPSITGDNTPATLSKELTTGILKEELGYEGLIITDSLSMGAITEICTPGEAAVRAVNAGADVLLMPSDFTSALEGLKNAVESGEISEERIDASVRKIIEKKLRYAEPLQ